MRTAIADAPASELKRRLARPASGLVRALARATRLARNAANAVEHGRLRRAENRLIALQAALEKFTNRLGQARGPTPHSAPLPAPLQGILEGVAEDTLRRASTRP